MNFKKKYAIGILSVFLCSGTVSANKTNHYPLLEKYTIEKNYSSAYQRALTLRFQNEGEPRFDYLYGLAALETGHYNEAVFSLERVTASEPTVIRPRLELARAYLKMNNNKAALREFRRVLLLSPPTVVKQKVNGYIIQIEQGGEGVRKAVINGLLTFSLGYDDNINFGFENEEINLPLFGDIRLDPSSVQQESGFAETRLQLNYRKADSTRFNRFASAALTHRENFDNSDFNISDLDLRAGLTFNRHKQQYQLVFRNRPVLLGGETYTNTIGIDTALRFGIGADSVLTGALSLEDYDHKVDSLRDRKRMVLSAKLDKKLADNIHQFSVFAGTEDPDNENGKAFSRDLMGVGYRIVRPWDANHKSFLKLDYHRNEHKDAYPLYASPREDNRLILKLGHEFRINKKLDLVFSVQHMNNDSNLELYDLTRNEIKAGVRYEWN